MTQWEWCDALMAVALREAENERIGECVRKGRG